MLRCLKLARLGAGYTAPNPMVGAILVYEDRIIAEGWHQKYGEAHAEPNCISQAIQRGFADVLERSTLYVSLEPCAHYGKTPPCADLIIKHKIPRVIVGCRDPFKEVDGKGIEKLKVAGIAVETGVLEKECKELNKRFFTFHKQHRPFVILKWAQTDDGFIAPLTPIGIRAPEGRISENSSNTRLFISNEFSNRLVHKWRSEEAALLVGTNTALLDDPELTTRLWAGHSPVRLVVDMDLKLPSSLKIFNESSLTIIFNTKVHSEESVWQAPPFSERVVVSPLYWQVKEDSSLVHQIVTALYQLKIQSVIVEGGAKLLQTFIDEGIWDEARVINNSALIINNGLPAPTLKRGSKTEEYMLGSDKIEIFKFIE
jgi:diaminohydroxyphosphoribosylaminopyrimidine deaminase / 5-amino-6-(5-phosphoribosylamino)uracil reductase